MPRFFEFLSLQHSNNNVHNIRLCRLVIANADLSSQELADMRVAEKVKPLLKASPSISHADMSAAEKVKPLVTLSSTVSLLTIIPCMLPEQATPCIVQQHSPSGKVFEALALSMLSHSVQ